MVDFIRRVQRLRWDDIAAVALFAANITELVLGPRERGSWIAAVPAGALLTLPLARRRQAPLTVLLLVVSGYAGQVAAVGDSESPTLLLCWVIAVYSVAAYAALPAALAGLAAGAVPIWVFLAAHPVREAGDVTGGEVVLLAVPWVAGRAVHQLRSTALIAEQRAAAIERATLAEAELAATAERARIAREMHDIVSHSVSLMIVQAEAGDALFESDPERARENLRAVPRAGRHAMTELRSMLGVLRGDGRDLPNEQPLLPALQRLADEVSAAGLGVELEVSGDERELAQGVALSVFRIVQEGLTNALKHARGGDARVLLRWRPTAVEIEVRDTGDHHDDEPAGYGLLGVQERVALCGGKMSAGPAEGGGFVICATLPVGAGL